MGEKAVKSKNKRNYSTLSITILSIDMKNSKQTRSRIYKVEFISKYRYNK